MQRGRSQAVLSGAQCQARRPWAQPGTQEAPSEHQAALLCWAGGGALAQAAQRGCGVSSLGISRSRLDVALGSLLWVSLLGQGWEQLASRGPCQPQPFCNSVTGE